MGWEGRIGAGAGPGPEADWEVIGEDSRVCSSSHAEGIVTSLVSLPRRLALLAMVLDTDDDFPTPLRDLPGGLFTPVR